MKNLKFLYYPDTIIYSETQFPLLLLCDTLHIVKTAEQDKETLSSDIFSQQGICQEYTPAPLGDDAERFRHLIRDVKLRKDDYAEQLSNLTLSEMVRDKKKENTESRPAILSTLLGNDAISKAEDKKINALWNARFLLALSEISDMEEEELAGHLNFFTNQELDMFKALHGGDEEPEDNPLEELMNIQQKLIKPNPKIIAKRAKAWFTLLSEKPLKNMHIWATRYEEAADIIFETYEKETGESPFLCEKISLPASIGRDEKTIADGILKIRKDADKERKEIASIFNHLTSPDTEKPSRPIINPAILDKWDTILESHFPEVQHGRKHLYIYFLGNFSPMQMAGNTEDANGLVCILK